MLNLEREMDDISLRINALRNQVATLNKLVQDTENDAVTAALTNVAQALNTAAEHMAHATCVQGDSDAD